MERHATLTTHEVQKCAVEIMDGWDESEGSAAFIEKLQERVRAKHDGYELSEGEIARVSADVNRITRRRLREIAARDECKRLCAVVDAILDRIDAIPRDDLYARYLASGEVCAYWSKIEKLVEPYPALHLPESVAEHVAASRAIYEDMRRALREARAAAARERRLAKRAPDPVIVEKRCSCGKLAKVGSLCKKCAHARGLLPHGKNGVPDELLREDAA
jgi:hypothetical protein